ncbi:MAG: caspase family protein [Nitrospiraceae bacterium]
MATKIISTVCGLYAVVILSGCSIAMALHGNKEPNFEHIKVGATKEEIDFEFNNPGTSKDLGDGNAEVTYKYEIGNSPNPARAGVNGLIDLYTIGLAELILTPIEFFRGKDVETQIVYGPDNKALEVLGYTPPPISVTVVAAQEEQEKYIRKRPVSMPFDQQRTHTPPSSLNVSPPLQPSDVDVLPVTKTLARKNAHAVVVGLERYRNELPQASYAERDARVVAQYLSGTMGYEEVNIALLLNDRATKGDMEKYFETWLPNRVESEDTVFVYFSGHGAPNAKTGETYLVPYDGDPVFLNNTGYPLSRLYQSLADLPAKEVVVVLDSCFSGAGGRSVIAKGMRPIITEIKSPLLGKGKTIVLAASSGQQVSSTYEQKAHGLMTYFFLKGLQGEADTNKDGKIDIAELFEYLRPQVERVARRDFNNEQTPLLLGDTDMLVRGVYL